MFFAIGRITLEHARKKTNFLHLNEEALIMLMFANRIPGINQSALNTYFHTDKSTVARTLQKLENKKLIYRKRDEENLRSYKIYLTPEGNEQLKIIEDVILEFENKVASYTKNYDQSKNDIASIFVTALFSWEK
ncbi:hypothetical protein SCULI_v1c05510 [Spiroplasma culicicola AES-1]|uniref:HTH marR-type domain-containing protein n=2 Tax=Spiroplasma culicicola TaxID=216935 RepID=W6A7C6_9MOLU|nr:hypothetical protein SCULI_v1c05510 [Spiroplasma culicicola AES-1]